MRTCKLDEVDEVLYRWFKQARSMSAPLSGTVLIQKASEIASEMGLDDFIPSCSWLERFKKRRGIVFKAVCGESAAVDSSQTEEWLDKTLPDILKEYGADDVFNVDETGLFFRCLPDRTLAFKGEECSGGKLSKERITVLVGGNMSGNQKLPLLTIGHSANPRCFKNVKKLPLEYLANKKAWMTSAIFENWVRKLDTRFLLEGRSVVLIVDNCPAHPEVENLKSIKLKFLPPNTTSKLQPCDQGIIQSLKRHYRSQVLQRYLAHIQAHVEDSSVSTASKAHIIKSFSLSLLDALYMLRLAWNKVTETTVSNCFRHAGFKHQEPTSTEISETTSITTDMQQSNESVVDPEEINLFEQLRDLVPDEMSAEAFYRVDTDLLTCEEETLETIIADVQQNNQDNSQCSVNETQEDSDEDVSEEIISARDARLALTTLRKYGEQQGVDDMIENIGLLEQQLNTQLMANSKQKTISDYFTKC